MTNKIPFHVGSYIKDVIKEVGITNADFAKRAGVDVEVIDKLVNEEIPVNKDLALKLERVTKVDYKTWLNLQKTYEERIKR
ncbi:HigA family addiction module antitoxin [Lagierella sp. ICN-221743]